jgi:CDP-glycerol glycerophosphotransferase (TagB/SpsB family)
MTIFGYPLIRRPINFVFHRSGQYGKVQDNIFGVICSKLDKHDYSFSVDKYVKKSLNMTLFVRELADVVMSHGVADKNYFNILDSGGAPFVSRFAHVLVPGPWLRNKLVSDNTLNLDPEKVHVVGWPRLDYLLECKKKTSIIGSEKVNILWAPTHDYRKRGSEQRSTSTFPEFGPYFEMMKPEFNMVESVHPRNRSNKQPTGNALVEADIVVSDFGTMVYETWALGKPVIFPRWILGDRIQEYLPGSAEAHIFEKRIGYHPDTYEEMLEQIRAGVSIGSDVQEFMEEYLPSSFLGRSSELISQSLYSFLG